MSENIEDEIKNEDEIIDECLEAVEDACEENKETVDIAGKAEINKIAVLESKCSDYLDKYQRTLAEFDNFRKRTSREKASMYDDGVKDTIEKLLPVIDNIERALAAIEPGTEDDSLTKGIKMILKQFQDTLATLGVEEIKALGEKFDPTLHAAVAHEDDEAYGENEIIIDMLKGYKYKDKVIRHSMVKVAN